jgi:hypothetical protein
VPYKSKARHREFVELIEKGEITQETFEEWNRETDRQELPERVDRSKKKGKRKKTARRKTATRTAAKRKTAKRKTAKRKAKKR